MRVDSAGVVILAAWRYAAGENPGDAEPLFGGLLDLLNCGCIPNPSGEEDDNDDDWKFNCNI
jgi:hypothetical protein